MKYKINRPTLKLSLLQCNASFHFHIISDVTVVGLLGGGRDAEMLAATANAYLLQQQQQSPSLAHAGPYTTAAAAAMMMLPPPSPLPVPVSLSTASGDAPPPLPLSRVSPAPSLDLGLRPDAHRLTGNGGRFVQTMADNELATGPNIMAI